MIQPTIQEIKEKLEGILECLGYARYDINPIVNVPTDLELMQKIQGVVISDLDALIQETQGVLDMISLFNPTRKTLREGNRCEKELYVEKHFGLPDDINENTKVDTDFGTLVGLLYGFEESSKEEKVMKPLSELANPSEDASKVFDFVFGPKSTYEGCTNGTMHDTSSMVRMWGTVYDCGNNEPREVIIERNGSVSYWSGSEEMDKTSNPFELVRFINNLGYDISNDAITETT